MADRESPITLTIRLNRIEDWFTAPPADPFQPGYHTLAGIDQIAAVMAGRRSKNGVQVTFVLPESVSQSGKSKADVQAAIERYCDVRIGLAQTELDARYRAIQRNIRVGLLLLALSLAAGSAITSADFIPERLGFLLSNAISILGTVALWTPVDALLFGLRSLRKSIGVYCAIKGMSFDLRYVNGD